MTTIIEKFGLPRVYDTTALDAFVAGIECEIEAISKPVSVDGFSITQDGSLRNPRAPKGYGHEYISFPLPREALVTVFTKLHQKLEFYPDEDPFSSRTSTHVHVNCQNLELDQTRTLVLLYALFEEMFFLMVDKSRRGNIHCVPLNETTMPNLYKKSINVMIVNWHKYTALNLKPLAKLGTVEFRHLHGTNDPELLNQWLSVLENLWRLSQEVKVNSLNLQKETVIRSWFEYIFAPAPGILKHGPSLFDVIRNSLVDVKFSVL